MNCLKIFVPLLLAIFISVDSKIELKYMNKTPIFYAIEMVVRKNFIENGNHLLLFACFDERKHPLQYGADAVVEAAVRDIKNLTYKIFFHHQKKFLNIRHNEVVLLEDMKSFRHFYANLYKIGNINMSRTLLYINSIKTLDHDTIYMIFKYLYHMSIIRVALIVELSRDNVVLVTYYPFTPTKCRDFEPVVINHFLPEERRWATNDFFPSKLDDFYGCPLICCTWLDMPYFGLKSNRQNTHLIDYTGIEAELLKYMAEKLNFSIKIHWIDGGISYNINEEATILGKLFAESCDFALGGFHYRKDLDHLSPFSQTHYFFLSNIYIVTNIINFCTKYEKLAFPFHYNLWFVLGLICAVSSLLICICDGRRRQWRCYRDFIIGSANRTPHFNFYTLAVGANMATKQMPKRNFARFLLTCWLLVTLILRSAYQSGMYQMLRDNKQWNLPHTIENVFEQNYLISMTPENRRYLSILPNVKRLRIFNTSILSAYADILNANEPIAFITPYEYFGYFAKVNVSQWQHMHLVKERLLTQQLTIYVRHNSYLIPELNNQIAEFHYYGFVSLWNRRIVLPLTAALKYAKERNAGNQQTEAIALSMQELGAIFVILISMEIFSIAVFLIELIWHRYEHAIKQRLFAVD